MTWAATATLLWCAALGALCAPSILARLDPEKHVSRPVCRAVAVVVLVLAWLAWCNAEASTWQWILVLFVVPWLFATVAMPLFLFAAAALLHHHATPSVPCCATHEIARTDWGDRRTLQTRMGGVALHLVPAAQHASSPTVRLLPPGDGAPGQVPEVLRLVTFIDTDDEVINPRRISITADHQALLNTGIYVPLINNRGWTQIGPPTLWADTSIEQIASTARAVVGSLTPLNGCPDHCLRREHWTHLSTILHAHGATITPEDLPRLPHHVVVGDRLQARLGSVTPEVSHQPVRA